MPATSNAPPHAGFFGVIQILMDTYTPRLKDALPRAIYWARQHFLGPYHFVPASRPAHNMGLMAGNNSPPETADPEDATQRTTKERLSDQVKSRASPRRDLQDHKVQNTQTGVQSTTQIHKRNAPRAPSNYIQGGIIMIRTSLVELFFALLDGRASLAELITTRSGGSRRGTLEQSNTG